MTITTKLVLMVYAAGFITGIWLHALWDRDIKGGKTHEK